MYKLVRNFDGVRRLYADGSEDLIPSDDSYPQWREYQRWLAEGNVADEAWTLDEAKRAQLDLITTARNAALATLVAPWDGDLWDANEETSNRIANALSMIREAESQNIPAPGEIPWRTADNKTRVLSLPELTAMGASVFGAQQMVWGKNAMLKDAILAADTIAAVEAVVW